MPYIPPHLRPGYVPTAPKVIDYKGRVHWPTNLNTHRANNIIQPSKMHLPTNHGIVASKSVMKLTAPIQLNNSPIVRPGTRVNKFHVPVKRNKTQRKRNRRLSRSRRHKPSKKTR